MAGLTHRLTPEFAATILTQSHRPGRISDKITPFVDKTSGASRMARATLLTIEEIVLLRL